jgi:hypothetical protein
MDEKPGIIEFGNEASPEDVTAFTDLWRRLGAQIVRRDDPIPASSLEVELRAINTTLRAIERAVGRLGDDIARASR